MKADEPMDGPEGKEKYSNFEYLYKKVHVMQEAIEQMQAILNENNLHIVSKEFADTNIDDETFKSLDNENVVLMTTRL